MNRLNISPGEEIRALQEDEETRVTNPRLFDPELELIEALPKCNLGPFFLSDVNADEMQTLVRDQFFNANMLNIISCITQVIATIGNNSVRRWFKKLRVLGSGDNVMGNAMLASWDETDNQLFLIKAPKNPKDQTTIHELFIGLFGTNSLRADGILNFAYVYGGFRCSNPIINPQNKTVTNWCHIGQNAYYVIYENIADAKEFHEMTPTMNFTNFFNYYLQVLLALRAAVMKCRFTHYDLHDRNILLFKINVLLDNQNKINNHLYLGAANPGKTNVNFISLPYETKDGKRYLQTDTLAVIIDYGNAEIAYNGKTYANTNMLGVYAKPFLLGDAFRFLGWTMSTALDSKNAELFNGCTQILSFFTRMDPKRFIIESRNSGFLLTPSPELNDFGIDDLIDHMLKINNILTTSPAATVLSCNESDFCLSRNQILDKIGINPLDGLTNINNIYTLWDHINAYAKTNNVNSLDGLLQNLNVNQIMMNAIADYNNLAREIELAIKSLLPFSLAGLKFDTILDSIFLSQYIYNISQVMAIVDDLYNLGNLYDLLMSVKAYLDLKIDLPEDRYKSLATELNPYVTSILNDVEIAKKVISNPLYNIQLARNPKSKWLEDVLVMLELDL